MFEQFIQEYTIKNSTYVDSEAWVLLLSFLLVLYVWS